MQNGTDEAPADAPLLRTEYKECPSGIDAYREDWTLMTPWRELFDSPPQMKNVRLFKDLQVIKCDAYGVAIMNRRRDGQGV